MPGRIGNFLPHYPAPGGTTNAVRGLSRALVRAGWGAVIYCYASGNVIPKQYCESGVCIVRFAGSAGNPFRADPSFLRRLAGNEDEIDLLVLHGMFSPGNLMVGEFAKLAGIPYVVCPHDPYHPELLKKNRWRKALYGSVYERPFLKAASGIQLLAEAHRRFLSQYGVERPAFVVPNGFDPAGLLAARWPIREVPQMVGDPRFLHLGRLDMHHKGLDLLLHGLAMALRQGNLPRTTMLDFVGSDWGDQHKLESLTKQLGICRNVRFLGRITDCSAAAIIASYDVLVLPSRFDGFGLAALEAMVAAKPVLVSDEAGIASLVEQAACGYLVKPDVNSIANGLAETVQTRDQWEHLGQRGRVFAYEHLTWDESVTHAIRGYEKILSGASSDRDLAVAATAGVC